MSVLRALTAGARWAREIAAPALDAAPAWSALRVEARPLGRDLGAAFDLDPNGPARWVSRDAGAPLDDARGDARLTVIAPGAYGGTPTRAARTRLLAWSIAGGTSAIVHVPAGGAGSHAGRVVIDGLRAVRRAAGADTPERGDRVAGAGGFVHAFFDEEALLTEIAEAGADVTSLTRRDAWLYIHPRPAGTAARESADPFGLEVRRVLALCPRADALRRRESPERAIAEMREAGRRAVARGPVGRARLRRAIGWVDAMFPGGHNCYRRTLLELGLDRGAAGEPLVFGLDVGKTGHVAFKHREPMPFDVVFDVEP